MKRDKEASWIDFGPLVQRPKPSIGCNIRGHFCLGPLQQRQCQAGFAGTRAEAAKCQKYHDLQSNYHCQRVAMETTGVYAKSTAPFLS